jgi:hypothetical protein
MATQVFTVLTDDCVRCGGNSGPEVVSGDSVKMFLDQEANPEFPEFVPGIVVSVPESGVRPRAYEVQYETADLNGAAALLRSCDVTSVLCVSCCEELAAAMEAAAAAAAPRVTTAGLVAQFNVPSGIAETIPFMLIGETHPGWSNVFNSWECSLEEYYRIDVQVTMVTDLNWDIILRLDGLASAGAKTYGPGSAVVSRVFFCPVGTVLSADIICYEDPGVVMNDYFTHLSITKV